MKSRLSFITAFLCICLLLTGACAPAGAPSAPAAEAPAAEAPAAPSAAEPVTLNIVVPSIWGENEFISVMDKVVQQIGTEHNVTIEFNPQFVSDYCPWCHCMPAPNHLFEQIKTVEAAGQPPDIILVGSQSVPLFSELEFAPVPDDILQRLKNEYRDENEVSAKAINPFKNPQSQVVIGIPQGTAPILLIYRWDILEAGGEATKPGDVISWDQMITYIDKFGVIISPEPSIAMAVIQSANPEIKSVDLFDNGGKIFFELATGYGSKLTTFFDSSSVRALLGYPAQLSVFTSAMPVKGFDRLDNEKDTAVAFAFSNSVFLADLAGQNGNENMKIGVAYLPSFGGLGTATHTAGWMVSSKSEHSDLAWAVADALSKDPEMLKLGLQHGLLPLTDERFNNVFNLEETPNLWKENRDLLKKIALNSTAWEYPTTQLDGDFSGLAMASSGVMNMLAEGKFSFGLLGNNQANNGDESLDNMINLLWEVKRKE